jgi:hypothetical protein
MSLINDALQRAKESEQNKSPGMPPLQPVKFTSRGGIGWLLPASVVVFVTAACFFIGLSLTRHTPVPAANAPESSEKRPEKLVSAPEAVSVVTPPAAVADTNPPAISNAIVEATPPPPEPKLQGILFDPKRPCAIVDGAMVFAGDRVRGFRVTAISRHSVTLKKGTDTKVLSLD